MKKVLSFGCSTIAHNNAYICVGGNQIGIIDRSSGMVLKTIKGVKNITSLKMNDEYIYAKTTNGIYYIFDLKTQELQYKDYCRERLNTSHDGKFFLYEREIILDVLKLKDEVFYLIKYDFVSRVCEKVCVSKFGYSRKDWCVDFIDRKAYILFVEKCCLNHSQTNSYISIVNIDTLEIEAEIPLIFEYGVIPIGLVNTHSILLNNMQIIDTSSLERILLDSYNCFRDETCGYFVRMEMAYEKLLILVFSKCVFIYNLLSGNMIQKCDCQYGHNAMCIDEKIYIATWEGLFLVEKTENSAQTQSITHDKWKTVDGSVS